MKGFILAISCFLLMLVLPMDTLVGDVATQEPDVCCLTEEGQLVNEDVVTADDMLYDDVVPCRQNRLAQRLRTMSWRIQFRILNERLVVKRITSLLSVYYSILVNHISQSYSTLKLLCWQYSVDCYVFAFRQILI